MFYVYILKSLQDGKMYIGYTEDLRRRLSEHNKGLSKSTKGRKPFELIYYEAYMSNSEAQTREMRLKRSAGARTALVRRLFTTVRQGLFV